MKKVYVFSLCMTSFFIMILFQNCSKAQVSGVADAKTYGFVDSAVNTFDESAKFSITSSMNHDQGQFLPVYEYRIIAGFRRACTSENDYLDGFEERCSNVSGFRVLSDGTLVKFYQFLDRKEIQYNIGYYGEKQFDSFQERSDEIIKTNAPLVDLNESAPICMDAAVTTQLLFNDQGEEFILAQHKDCHEFSRNKDASAVQIATVMERLSRRVVKIAPPQKYVLLEKRVQVGFRSVEMPGEVLVRIYSDGRVIKKTSYNDQSKDLAELINILSNQDIDELNQSLGQLYGHKMSLQDTSDSMGSCADAPHITYSFHELLNHALNVREAKEAYINVNFAQEANCRSFRDPRLVQHSENLIKFIDQF